MWSRGFLHTAWLVNGMWARGGTKIWRQGPIQILNKIFSTTCWNTEGKNVSTEDLTGSWEPYAESLTIEFRCAEMSCSGRHPLPLLSLPVPLFLLPPFYFLHTTWQFIWVSFLENWGTTAVDH